MKLQPGNYGKETSFEVRNFDAAIPLDEYARLPKHPLYLVLDNLRSAFNVGSIFRTADAARLQAIYTCGYTAHPPHPKLDKTALGTVEYIETRHFSTTLEAIEDLRARNVPVWALETTSQSHCYTEPEYPHPLALIVGNEALGIERETLEHCEELVEIPMYGYKNSLNVAAASAVLCFEILRQWQRAGSRCQPTANA